MGFLSRRGINKINLEQSSLSALNAKEKFSKMVRHTGEDEDLFRYIAKESYESVKKNNDVKYFQHKF